MTLRPMARLVPSAGRTFAADTTTVFDKRDHGAAVPGTAGVDCFRIPSLARVQHPAGRALFAFAEARATNGVEPGQDCVPTGIAMKRSTTDGRSWSALSYPVPPTFKPATANGLGDRSANPVTVWDGRRLHLHFLKGARSATDCAPGSAADARLFRNFYGSTRGTWARPGRARWTSARS